VLVVDDSPPELNLVATLFRKQGHRVSTAANGAEALLALNQVRVDLVVSDGSMPILDGYQLCRLLKDEPATRSIPVILLTGQAEGLSRFWAKTCGADRFLVKGRNTDQVVEAALELASQAESSPPSAGDFTYDRTELGIETLQKRLGKALEHRLLETALRDTIGHLYSLRLDPADLLAKMLELLHELALPGAVYLVIPGDEGLLGAGLHGSTVTTGERAAMEEASRRFLGREDAWPSTWMEMPSLRPEATGLQDPVLFSLPVGLPGRSGSPASGSLTLFTERRSLLDYEHLFEVACEELFRLIELADSQRTLAQAEAALHQAQKTQSLALMAGGIAHDFNNLFQGILANLELADHIAVDERSKLVLAKAIVAVQTGGRLSRKLLEFTGAMWYVPVPLDLHALVQEAFEARYRDPVGVEILLDLAAVYPEIKGDRNYLLQALAQLLDNAVEAIGDGPGRITISTREHDALDVEDGTGCRWLTDPPAGRSVRLTIADDGCGASEEVLGRMFDPFFTTKQLGRGLGLPAVLGILKAHGAALQVESRVGEGITFHIWFPPAD
jgi:signal transduction histidine kinase/FixJ family two-component response regulator